MRDVKGPYVLTRIVQIIFGNCLICLLMIT